MTKVSTTFVVRIGFLFLAFLHASFCWAQIDQKRVNRAPRKVTGPRISELQHFVNVPLSDKSGVVITSFLLPIPEMQYPFNGSIVETKKGYCVAFRYDLPWKNGDFKKARIGLFQIDKEFRPIGAFEFLNTTDEHAEDPRIFYHDSQYYISYTHVTAGGAAYECNIGLAQINAEAKKVQATWEMKYKEGTREKNWTPFSYTNKDKTSDLYYIYEYNPWRIVRLRKPFTGEVEWPFKTERFSFLNGWEQRWGKIRGGTPALRLDSGEYLAFFHSSFQETCVWYVVGAALFEGQPPFRLKAISKFPILFKGMYDTPMDPRQYSKLRNLFPGGFVQAKFGNKDVFHLICGSNESAVRVVTLDRNKLLRSLENVGEATE